MGKIISERWAEKDDPIYTGRFTISSRKSKFEIISFEENFKEALKKMLREYLEYTAKFLKEEPWNCSIDIEHELAKTFDNLGQFKAPKGEILLAVINGKAIGTASIKMIRGNASELTRMYIEPNFQGQKIGQQLLEATFKKSIQLGASEMYLESPPPFKPAHKLYQKNGFEIIEEYPEVSIPQELRFNWVYMKKSNLSKEDNK